MFSFYFSKRTEIYLPWRITYLYTECGRPPPLMAVFVRLFFLPPIAVFVSCLKFVSHEHEEYFQRRIAL